MTVCIQKCLTRPHVSPMQWTGAQNPFLKRFYWKTYLRCNTYKRKKWWDACFQCLFKRMVFFFKYLVLGIFRPCLSHIVGVTASSPFPISFSLSDGAQLYAVGSLSPVLSPVPTSPLLWMDLISLSCLGCKWDLLLSLSCSETVGPYPGQWGHCLCCCHLWLAFCHVLLLLLPDIYQVVSVRNDSCKLAFQKVEAWEFQKLLPGTLNYIRNIVTERVDMWHISTKSHSQVQ